MALSTSYLGSSGVIVLLLFVHGTYSYVVVSLNYCSQNGEHVYRAPYYNGNPNIGPRIIGNLDQSPCVCSAFHMYLHPHGTPKLPDADYWPLTKLREVRAISNTPNPITLT